MPARFPFRSSPYSALSGRLLRHALSLALSAPLLWGISASADDTSAQPTTPRNVILLVGDGMDDHQLTIARNYLKGTQGQLLMDQLPVRGAVQVLTADEDQPDKPVYVADSANSATAMATGQVTSRGRIGTGAGDDRDFKTIAEHAQAAGYRVGIVSTASITDATPASFISHVNQRACENPQMMVNAKVYGQFFTDCSNDLKRNGGLGSIAEQIADSPYDILLGGGQKHFAVIAEQGGQTLAERAQAQGFHLSQSSTDIAQLPNDQRVLGLYANKHLPTQLRGEQGRVAEKPTPSLLNQVDWRLGEVTLPAPMHCEPNPDFDERASLANLTQAALQHLSGTPGRGFFLMVESASIDKQSHQRNPCGSIGEVAQLEDSLALALAFAETHPDTLILVTADHGQAAQLIPDTSLFQESGAPVYTPGHLARITTPEQAVMAVNYATNDFPMEEHTGVNVPLFANAPGQGLVAPLIRQPQLFDIMMTYLQLDIPSPE